MKSKSVSEVLEVVWKQSNVQTKHGYEISKVNMAPLYNQIWQKNMASDRKTIKLSGGGQSDR